MSNQRLPFKLEPKIKTTQVDVGSPDCGVVTLEKYGYLKVKENASSSDAVFKQTQLLVSVNKLANRIMKETGKSKADTLEFINNPTLDPELGSKYDEDILGLVAMQVQSTEDFSQVTTMIKYRTVSPDGTVGLPNWTVEDTAELDHVLYNAIYDFYVSEVEAENKEQAKEGGVDADSPKPKSRKPREQTGVVSTGL